MLILIVTVQYLVKSANYEFPHYVVILHPSLTSSLLRWPALIYILSPCSFLVLPHQRRGQEHVWNQIFSSVFTVILNVTLSCLFSSYLFRITVYREGHCNHKRTRACFCLMFYKSKVTAERTLLPCTTHSCYWATAYLQVSAMDKRWELFYDSRKRQAA
jgi:hypothetical protein